MRRFPHIVLGVGLRGNALFIVGSLLFMTKQQTVGVWAFLLGSGAMFLGTMSQLVRAAGRRRLERYQVDPEAP